MSRNKERPKIAILRDNEMSDEEKMVDSDLHPGNFYQLGRAPPKNPSFINIHILQYYTPRKDPHGEKAKLGKSVSRLQLILEVDEMGLIFVIPKSENSPTYGIPENEIPQDRMALDYMQTYRLYKKTQVFPGDLLVLGDGYRMQLVKIDRQAEVNLLARIRMSDTQVLDPNSFAQ